MLAAVAVQSIRDNHETGDKLHTQHVRSPRHHDTTLMPPNLVHHFRCVLSKKVMPKKSREVTSRKVVVKCRENRRAQASSSIILAILHTWKQTRKRNSLRLGCLPDIWTIYLISRSFTFAAVSMSIFARYWIQFEVILFGEVVLLLSAATGVAVESPFASKIGAS